MSTGIVINDLSSILVKGLSVSEIIEKDLPYSSIAKKLEDLNKSSISVKIQMLNDYMDGVLEKNESINLTAITDRSEFILKHYEDSMSVLPLPEYREAKRILDLGTGGGFPGVPLAITDPDKSFLLVDSLEKRLKVIDELCNRIGVLNADTMHGRAEDLGRDPELRGRFDMVLSRAVADLAVLAEYCLPFLRVGGTFVAYKKADSETEIENAKKAIGLLGGRLDRIEHYELENHGSSLRNALVVINKTEETPDKFPRRAGMPSKRPL